MVGHHDKARKGTVTKHEVTAWLEQWGYEGSVDDCLREWFEADSTLNHEMLELASQLRQRGVPCHLASTQERHRAAYLEQDLGFADRFERRFFSYQLGVRKPDPEFYRRVTEELGVLPSSLLFLDDQAANVAAARDAGWYAEVYARGDELAALLEKHVIVAAP